MPVFINGRGHYIIGQLQWPKKWVLIFAESKPELKVDFGVGRKTGENPLRLQGTFEFKIMEN